MIYIENTLYKNILINAADCHASIEKARRIPHTRRFFSLFLRDAQVRSFKKRVAYFLNNVGAHWAGSTSLNLLRWN